MNTNTKYQIYCDMDGVLVDFERGVVDLINKDIKDANVTCRKMLRLRKNLTALGRDYIIAKDLDKINKQNQLITARRYMYHRCSNDEELWATLPWTKDGKKLWDFISAHNPYILTAPLDDDECREGKRRWIEKNLSPQPEKIFMSHDKDLWATTAGRPNILIDDFTINTIPWTNKGGHSILYVTADKAIKELQALLR